MANDLRVRAIAKGYYGEALREPGEEFTLIDEAAFSEVWMERVGDHAGREADPVGEVRGRRPRRGATEPVPASAPASEPGPGLTGEA